MALLSEYSKVIRDYDEMLFMDEESLSDWRVTRVGGTDEFTEKEIVQLRQETTLAIVQHVIEDFLKWTPEEACRHFTARVAKMYRLDRVLCAKERDRERIPSYGFMRFTSLEDVNFHYVLSLLYPDKAKFQYGSKVEKFSYAHEAVAKYRHILKGRDIASRGGAKTDVRLSKYLLTNISLEDEVATVTEFMQVFVNEYCALDIKKSGKGRAYDIYRFFSNRKLVSARLKESGLGTVFNGRALGNYDLICDYISSVTSKDDPFYRKVFSYISASTLDPQ